MDNEEGGSGIVLVLCGLVGAGVLAGLLLPAFSAPREHSGHRHRCSSKLKQIGYALHLYSGDHNEKFPPGLGWLFPSYIPDGNVFVCTEAVTTVVIGGGDLPPGATDASAVFGPGNTDYDYVPGLTSVDPPDCVLAYGGQRIHGDGRHVLLIGGNVQWTKEKEFQAALEKTRKYLAKRAAAEAQSR